MFVRSNNTVKIRSISIWLEAFHVFVAIYCSKFPAEIGHLMTYAQIVQGISSPPMILFVFLLSYARLPILF